MTPRAFSYRRFSSKKQEKGDSIRRQEEFARKVCEENNWVLDDTLHLADLGVSAFRGGNAKVGALAEFLEAVRRGRVPEGSVLIIESIDRLSRNKVGAALQLFIGILNSGVSIVTAEPRRTYSQDSINDIAALLEPIIYMSRAHEESATKSMRLKAAWGQKKKRAAEDLKPLTRMTPSWVRLVDGKYQLIGKNADTVRAMFRMAREGLGAQRIAQALSADPEKYPPIARGGRWHVEYVRLVLKSRTVLGEYQPGTRDEKRKWVPAGAPVPNYYPAVVTETEFYLAQAAKEGRKGKSGQPGKDESNLFTGIVYHAGDRAVMRINTTPATKDYTARQYLASSAVRDEGKGRRGEGRTFPYPVFEAAVLEALARVVGTAFSGREAAPGEAEREADIARLNAELLACDQRKKEAEREAARADPKRMKTYFALIDAVEDERERVKARLAALAAEAAARWPADPPEVRSPVARLAGTAPDRRQPVRLALKARVRAAVDQIWVHVEEGGMSTRTCHAQIYLRDGGRIYTHCRTFHHRQKDRSPAPTRLYYDADFRAGFPGGT